MFSKRVLGLLAVLGVVIVAGAAGRSFFSRQEIPIPEPTKEHKMILKGVGEWEGTMSMTGPDGKPMSFPAHESVEALGELWTISRFRTEFFGVKFVGSAVSGYDTEKKKFVSTWIDSMSTHVTIMEGDWDEKTKTQTMRYTAPHPMTGKPAPHRMVLVCGEDSYKNSFYVGSGEEEMLTMSLDMKRVKSAMSDDDDDDHHEDGDDDK